MSDVVATLAVATRGAHREEPVFVCKGDRDSVDLQLNDVSELFFAKQLVHTPVKFAQLVRVIGVVDRQHRLAMPDRDETIDRLRRRHAALGYQA